MRKNVAAFIHAGNVKILVLAMKKIVMRKPLHYAKVVRKGYTSYER